MALLSVAEDAAWHQVHLLLASAIGARPATTSDTGLGDLFALADAIAAGVGGATAIEDPRQRILAYSTVPGQAVDEDRRQGILGLQVPASAENTEQYRRLFAADRPVRLPALTGSDLPAWRCRCGPAGRRSAPSGSSTAERSPPTPRTPWSRAPPRPPCSCSGPARPANWPGTGAATCCAACWRARRTRRRQPSGSGSRARPGWPRSSWTRPRASRTPSGPRCACWTSYACSARRATGGTRACWWTGGVRGTAGPG
ncbi:hypothetical protein O1M54_30620 [Streptomyces diastatochromogenes]|nr:hypothetical protein [Streptomyces diastatochromogenes]